MISTRKEWKRHESKGKRRCACQHHTKLTFWRDSNRQMKNIEPNERRRKKNSREKPNEIITQKSTVSQNDGVNKCAFNEFSVSFLTLRLHSIIGFDDLFFTYTEYMLRFAERIARWNSITSCVRSISVCVCVCGRAFKSGRARTLAHTWICASTIISFLYSKNRKLLFRFLLFFSACIKMLMFCLSF